MNNLKKWLLIVVAFVAIGLIIFQSFTIHNLKKEQEEQFSSHIALAAQRLGEYKETRYDFMYEDALMELHSTSSVALLLEHNDSYKGLHGVLLSIVGTYYSFPEDLALFTDELYAILDHFSVNHDAEDLYAKLNQIDNTLTGMMMDRTEKVD